MSQFECLISGLSLLSSSHPELQIGAAHDIIVVGPIELKSIDPALYNSLCDLGWHYSKAHGGMAFFT